MDPAKYEFQSDFAKRYFGAGKTEGRMEGRTEGRTEIVLKLLALRFGTLPAAVEARIRTIGGEELDGIAARMLSARTLEDALGSRR